MMRSLDDLIREFCPNGVEYKDISSFAKNENGKNKGQKCDRAFSITQSGLIPTSEYFKDAKITSDDTSGYKLVKHHWFVYSPSRIDVGSINYLREKEDVIVSPLNVVFSVNEKIVKVEYLLYFLQSRRGTWQILTKRQGIEGTGRKLLPFDKFGTIQLPVPPLPVQEKVVDILNTFTSLITELQAELDARKSQYKYYLNSYYGSQKNNLVPLDSLGTLTRGKRFVHDDGTEDGVPCIHYGELYTFYGAHANKVKSHIREELRAKMRYAHKGDVIIVGAGENNIDIGVGVAWEGNEDVAVHDACYTLRHEQNAEYISYFLRSDIYHSQIKKYVSEGKICSISAAGLGKALIPIPDLQEQNRVTAILRQFDAICNDDYNGLPAEIQARQKQYEYYRDKILSFSEVK